jgi:hypothetical protein
LCSKLIKFPSLSFQQFKFNLGAKPFLPGGYGNLGPGILDAEDTSFSGKTTSKQNFRNGQVSETSFKLWDCCQLVPHSSCMSCHSHFMSFITTENLGDGAIRTDKMTEADSQLTLSLIRIAKAIGNVKEFEILADSYCTFADI